jgi:hypothetical protein
MEKIALDAYGYSSMWRRNHLGTAALACPSTEARPPFQAVRET